jgi:hypothetical protein
VDDDAHRFKARSGQGHQRRRNPTAPPRWSTRRRRGERLTKRRG